MEILRTLFTPLGCSWLKVLDVFLPTEAFLTFVSLAKEVA